MKKMFVDFIVTILLINQCVFYENTETITYK